MEERPHGLLLHLGVAWHIGDDHGPVRIHHREGIDALEERREMAADPNINVPAVLMDKTK